jgi:hypothetical protein
MAGGRSNHDQLDLVDYVTSLDRSVTWIPDQLVLPRPVAESMSQLYRASEAADVEHGFQLLFDREARKFSTGTVCVGDRGSVDTGPRQDSTLGDAHGHPTATFGYEGGFPAHSPQDIRDLASTTETKRYFFKFVTCGERIYAMVQHDNSLWNEEAEAFLKTRRDLEKQEMAEAIKRAGEGTESYQGFQLEFKELQELEEKEVQKGDRDDAETDKLQRIRLTALEQMFARKAQLGKTVENLTIDSCVTFANKFNYVFYAGNGYILSRITPDTRNRLLRL